MTRSAVALAALIALFVAAAPAAAFTCTPTGCTFEADYKETSTLVGGAPVTDLAASIITYQVAVDGGAPGAAKTVTVPASSPTGGGTIAQQITDTTLVAGHKYAITGSVVETRAAAANAPPSVAVAWAPLLIDQTGGTPTTPSTGVILK